MQKNFSYELFEKALLYKILSAYDFCKLAKIHSGTISNWKNVKEVKKLSHRAAIERVLGVKYDDLCEPSGLDGEKSKKTTLKSTDLRPSERSRGVFRCTQCGEKYKQSLESQAKDLVAVIVTALLIIGFFAIMSR